MSRLPSKRLYQASPRLRATSHEVDLISWTADPLGRNIRDANETKPPYPLDLRQWIPDLARTGRTPASLGQSSSPPKRRSSKKSHGTYATLRVLGTSGASAHLTSRKCAARPKSAQVDEDNKRDSAVATDLIQGGFRLHGPNQLLVAYIT